MIFSHGMWIAEPNETFECEEHVPASNQQPCNSLKIFLDQLDIGREMKVYLSHILNNNHQIRSIEDLKLLSGVEWNEMRVSTIIKAQMKAALSCKYIINCISLCEITKY